MALSLISPSFQGIILIHFQSTNVQSLGGGGEMLQGPCVQSSRNIHVSSQSTLQNIKAGGEVW